MLFRMHSLTTSFQMEYDEFARDVSDIDDLNSVLAVTDILISDYSTIVYDATILGIPFISFGFDYDTYRDERGFYFDLDSGFPGGALRTEDEVIKRIDELDKGMLREEFKAFREKYIKAGGHATENVLNELAEKLKLE